MIPRNLAAEHLRKHRKMVIATIVLLLLAFVESLYLSCYREPSPLFCPLSWVYAALAAIVVLTVIWYRN